MNWQAVAIAKKAWNAWSLPKRWLPARATLSFYKNKNRAAPVLASGFLPSSLQA
jgi:hypothetical protein